MTRYIHKTNRQNANPPASSEIEQGEICLNTFNLGSTSNGINNGRLYIKTDSGEIRRFIGLGLPGSSDPSLKTVYGGTNNSFLDATSNNVDGGDSIVVFQYSATSSPRNHVINRTANNKLTWSSGNNRLNINRSIAAQATVHVGGDLAVDTVNQYTSAFNSTFQIIGRDINDLNKLKQIPSNTLLSLLPDNSIGISKLSGVLPLTLGGTGGNFSSLFPADGSLVYYDDSTTRFRSDNDLKWNSSDNLLVLTGGFEFDPPNDTLNNAEPIGVDSANRIVRMDYTYNQNLNENNNVKFNKLILDNINFGEHPLVLENLQTDNNAMVLGVDTTVDDGTVVKTGYYLNQDLKTDSTVNFEKVTIDGDNLVGSTLVMTNIGSSSGGSALEIDSGGNVYKSSSSRKLKENIVNYNKGLDILLQLSPKYFNMINDPTKKLQAGLIAEDLHQLGLDEFVVKDKDDNPSGINYDKLVVLLINAIKNLNDKLTLLST